jgi:cell division initiation protein
MASIRVRRYRLFSFNRAGNHHIFADVSGKQLDEIVNKIVITDKIAKRFYNLKEVRAPMKITPSDIQQQQFRIRFRGFDVREVDSFLERVTDEFETLTRENSDRQKEIEGLRREIQEYRDREKTFKDAMINTQKALDDMRMNAEKEAELIVAEAEMKAEKMLSMSHNRLTQLHEDISELKRQRMQLEVELGTILETHRRLLDMNTEAMDTRETSEDKLKYLKGT